MKNAVSGIIFVFIFLSIALWQHVHAAESVCESVYSYPNLPPRGFGAPFSFVSQEQLLAPLACADERIILSVGTTNTFTYAQGYYWDDGWKQLSFVGGTNQNGWYEGAVSAVVPKIDDETTVLVYMCENTSSGWKCGCRDAACTSSRWMQQRIRTEQETLKQPKQSRSNASRSDTDHWVLAYYPSWDRIRLDRTDIPWEYMTHIAYGIAAPRADGTLNLEFDMDDDDGVQLGKRIARDAKRNDVTPILMIGGGAGNWISATNPDNVKTYARNLIDAMDDMGFEGIDIDWEPLYDSNLPQVEALAKELRRLDPDMILTIAIPYSTINQRAIAAWYGDNEDLFDQMNIMTYDMSGVWSGWSSWHHAALSGETVATPTSVESSVEKYLAAGVPRKKVGIGIPLYGRCWEGVGGPMQAIGADVVSHGAMSYRLIRREYYDDDNLEWDADAKSSYLSFRKPTGPDGCTFITYAEERDMKERGEYLVDEGLGGVILWSLGQGHMDEYSRSKRHPLLKSLWNELE